MFEVDGKIIREKLFERELSTAAFARTAGLNERTCIKLSRGGKCGAAVIHKAAKALGVKGNELLKDVG